MPAVAAWRGTRAAGRTAALAGGTVCAALLRGCCRLPGRREQPLMQVSAMQHAWVGRGKGQGGCCRRRRRSDFGSPARSLGGSGRTPRATTSYSSRLGCPWHHLGPHCALHALGVPGPPTAARSADHSARHREAFAPREAERNEPALVTGRPTEAPPACVAGPRHCTQSAERVGDSRTHATLPFRTAGDRWQPPTAW